MPTLRVIHRSSVLAGREVLVHDPVVRFGRDPTCQVLFDEAADRMVSRNHAEIRWDETGPVLFPTPGKLVIMRGNPVTGPMPLKSGDIIELAGAGGPSVEIVFDGPGVAPAAAGPAEHEEAVQKTVLEMMPAALMEQLSAASRPTGQNIVAANPARIAASSRHAPERPKPPAAPAPAAPPAEENVVGTAFLAPIDAAAMLSQDKEVVQVQQKVRSRTDLIRAALIGAVVLIAAGSLAAFFIVRARHERAHAVVQRIEAMLAQNIASGIVTDISDEDLKILDDEVAANHMEAAKARQVHEIVRKARENKAGQQPSTPKPTHEDDAAKKKAAEELAARQKVVRDAWTVRQHALIARLEAGKGKSEHVKELVADVKKTEADYEAAAVAYRPPGGDAIEQLLRSTARQLGECDALAPERFLTEARNTIERIRTDGPKREKLMAGIKQAADHRYGPTITAALADQGLPVELFFVPYMMTGFDEKRVGLPSERGIAKGMWQILPGPAETMQFKLGKNVESLDADPNDERQQYQHEVRRLAKGLRSAFLQQAGGSTLLFMATYDHGDTELLSATKHKAGIAPTATDPAEVSFWRVFEAKGLSDEVRDAALEYFATVAISEKPDQFGFTFAPPLEHVALEEKE